MKENWEYVSFAVVREDFIAGSQYVKHSFDEVKFLFNFSVWLRELSFDARIMTDLNLQVVPACYATFRLLDTFGNILEPFRQGSVVNTDPDVSSAAFNRTINLSPAKVVTPNVVIGGIQLYFWQGNFPYVTAGGASDLQINVNAAIERLNRAD